MSAAQNLSLPIPAKATVLVIGGGPGGSYSASALAREGIDVVLLEAAKMPRYHIGESMLPSLRPFMRFIDFEKKVEAAGFEIKPGAAVKFNQFKREGYTDFIKLDPENGSWNVIRSVFDEMLFKHAGENGAKIFDGVRVGDLYFSDDSVPGDLKPIAADYTIAETGEKGKIEFDYVVDASGRAGILSTRYLKNRRFNQSLHNTATWGYWRNYGRYMPGTTRDNAPWFEALTDESGWAWYIPLGPDTVSIGVVQDLDIAAGKKKALKEATNGESTLQDYYLKELTDHAPGLVELRANAELKTDGDFAAVKAAADFSYAASNYAGRNYRLVGDASAFIDPFFSSGVHLAFTGGLSAAATIASSIKGLCTEDEAIKFHDGKIGVAYTRFLMVVLGAYKQIRNQEVAVLCDVDEDNFDRAFDAIRPVIQGTAEAGKKLSENELQKTADFVRNVFAPTDPEMHDAVGARFADLAEANGTILTPEQIDEIVGDDEDAKHVLGEINARKPIHQMYDMGGNFTNEVISGFACRVERGKLGLVRV